VRVRRRPCRWRHVADVRVPRYSAAADWCPVIDFGQCGALCPGGSDTALRAGRGDLASGGCCIRPLVRCWAPRLIFGCDVVRPWSFYGPGVGLAGEARGLAVPAAPRRQRLWSISRVAAGPRTITNQADGHAGLAVSGARGVAAQRRQVHTEPRLGGGRCTRARARRRQAHAEWRLSGVRCTRSRGSAAAGAHGRGLGGGRCTRARARRVRRMRSGGLAASGAHARRSWDPGVAPATLSDHRVPVCDPAVVGNHCRRTRTTPTCFPADTSSAGPGRAEPVRAGPGGRGELGRASRAGLSWAGLSWARPGRAGLGRAERAGLS
jgi:hypothetical protein